MTLFLLALAFLLGMSATYSGSETGVYSLSRVRLEAEARAGRRSARILRTLVRKDALLLVTLLVGNNLMLELATRLFRGRLESIESLPEWTRELAVTVLLTPFVFLLGELVPKDLMRRRPHQMLSVLAPLLVASRVLFAPLVLPLVGLSGLLERVLGLRGKDLVRALRREEVLDVLQTGSREGALAPQAATLAQNVLVLRATPVSAVQVPWARVERVDLDADPTALAERVRGARFTRIPALAASEPAGEVAGEAVGEGAGGGPRVVGYLHQLEVLAGSPGEDPRRYLRPLPAFPADLSVDRALKRMRTSGQRIAMVGTPEAPEGLVSLMDLLATISGDPPR